MSAVGPGALQGEVVLVLEARPVVLRDLVWVAHQEAVGPVVGLDWIWAWVEQAVQRDLQPLVEALVWVSVDPLERVEGLPVLLVEVWG